MKQDTVDGSPSPKIIHQGEHFNRLREGQSWKQFKAVKISKDTERAFCILIKEANGATFEKWMPKSVVRIEEIAEGLIVKYPDWVT